MKHWSVTANMSQNLTSFSVFSTRQISRFATAERKKFLEDGKASSLSLATEKKPLLPVEPWIIRMVLKDLKERYGDIKDVDIIDVRIETFEK